MKRLVLALALVACKADLHHTVDAPPLDTAVDSLSVEPGDPPPNAVTVTITRIGAPVAGAGVYFQGPDSSLITATLTNDNGVAWALMPSGGYVTARDHDGAGLDHLSTFTGVQPSDSLVLDLSPTGGKGEHMLHITVPTDASAAAYRVFSPCGEAPLTSTSEDIVLVGCGTTTDLVVATLDADGIPTAALFQADVTTDGSATLSGTYQPLQTLALTYSNVPSFVTFVGTYEALSATQRAYSNTTGAVPQDGVAHASLQMPVSTGTELTATNLYPISTEVGSQTIYNWHAAAASYSLDVGSVLLPAFATQPAFDPASRVASWTERAGDQQPDVVRARIHIYRDAIPSGPSWSWRIVAARAGTSVTYPKLPVIDNVDFNPAAGDTITFEELTTLSIPGGFAGFRTKGFSEARNVIAGTLGRIVQQDLYFESL